VGTNKIDVIAGKKRGKEKAEKEWIKKGKQENAAGIWSIVN
jgi:hypothetical protein